MSTPSQFLWRVTNSCIVDGQTCQNVLHFACSPGLQANTIAETIAAQWLDQMRPFQHTGAVWVSVQAHRIDPGGLVTFTKPISIAGSGDTEREADNPTLSRKLLLKSNTGGRHGRGRIYIPGTTQASWAMGRVKPASLTAGQAIITTLMQRFTGLNPSTGLNLVIKTRANTTGAVFVDFIEQASILGVQRRRNIGVGI